MADIHESVEALRRFAVLVQGITQVADTLESLGSLQGQAEAAEAARVQALQAVEAAKNDAQDILNEAAATRDEAANYVTAARALAAEIRTAAERDALAIVEQANIDAAAEVSATIGRFQADITNTSAEAGKARTELEALRGEISELEAQKVARTAEYAELNDKLTAVRDAIAALRG